MDLAQAAWRKSSRSTNEANCVEFANPADSANFAVRDSKNVPGPALTFPAAAWSEFRSSGLLG